MVGEYLKHQKKYLKRLIVFLYIFNRTGDQKVSGMKTLLEESVPEISQELSIPESVLIAYLERIGSYAESLSELKEEILQARCGRWDNVQDFGYDMVNNFIDLEGQWWSSYINYHLIGEDLLSSDYFAIDHNNKIWVFRYI